MPEPVVKRMPAYNDDQRATLRTGHLAHTLDHVDAWELVTGAPFVRSIDDHRVDLRPPRPHQRLRVPEGGHQLDVGRGPQSLDEAEPSQLVVVNDDDA